MARKSTVSEAMENTIRGMLLSGKVTCEIVCDLNVPVSAVTRIRKALIASGKGNLWHTDNYLENKGWA